MAIIQIILQAVDRASAGINRARDASLQAQQKIATSARNIGIAMGIAGAAALLFARKASRSFREVEDAFANVSTLLEEGQNAMELFGDEVVRLSTSLPVQGGRVEVLSGLYQVLSAGITDTADATSVLEVAIKAARAGLTDTFTAVDVITTALNAYGLSADKASDVSDILFTAVKRGKLTFEDIASTIGRVTAIAAQLNVSFAEVAAAMATLTKQGFNAEEASTGLSATLTALLKPSEDMKIRLEELGFASGQMALESLGLAGTIQALTEGIESDGAALAELFPNVRALRTIMPLAGKAAEMFAEDLRAMEDATGAAGVAFAKTADTFSAKLTILKNRIDLAVESIGEDATPAMVGLTEVVATGAEGLAFLNEKTGGVIGAFMTFGGAALATIGPLIALIAQIKLMSIAKSINTIAHSTNTAALGVNTAAGATSGAMKVALAAKTAIVTAATHAWSLAMSLNPIGILIIAIAGLIAIIILIITRWDEVRGAMEAVWNFIKPVLIPVIDALSFVWDNLAKGIMFLIDNVLPFLFPPLLIWKLFGEDIMKAWSAIVDFFAGIWGRIVDGIVAFGSFILDLGNTFINWLVEGFKGIFGQFFDLGIQIMQAILDGILNVITGAGDFFGGIADSIIGFFTGSPQLDPALARRFGRIGIEMGDAITGGIMEGTARAEDAVRGVITGITAPSPGRAPLPAGGTTIHIEIGSIVASGAREGREAANALMRELKRRGIAVGLGA